MNLTAPFLIASGAAYLFQFLDWENTAKLIKSKGLAGESNPIMKFFFSKSPALALAFKFAPPTAMLIAGFAYHDVANYGVKYANASGTDHWALVWILAQAVIAGIGIYGFLSSKKA